MGATPAAKERLAEELRCKWYNSTVVSVRSVHEDLMVMRVRPDVGIPEFAAGQYTALGLGDWEPRVSNAGDEDANALPAGKLIRRAYSVSASLLDDTGQLVRAPDCDYLEFYITLVRHSGRKEPSLTPRLFHLRTGDRLSCMTRLHGNYTLGSLAPDKNVVFAATGTGEAPHNAMLAELLSRGHQGRIAAVVCVRYERDLGYLAVHRELERRHSNYRYLTLTTREAINLDPDAIGYVGKRYLQDYFLSGEFERNVGWSLSAADTEVFLCGSPDMIGISPPASGDLPTHPHPKAMISVLESRDFHIDQPMLPGNIHFEKYW